MKTIATILLGLAMTPTAANAATEDGLHVTYQIEMQHPLEGQPMALKGQYYIEEGRVRFESENPLLPVGDTVMIGTSNPRKAYLLFPARKAYMELPPSEAGKSGGAAGAEAPFKDTGRTKKIAGYSCKVVAREVKDPDLGDRKEEACTSAKLIGELKVLETALPRSESSQGNMPKGLDGFPLEYRVLRKDPGESKDQVAMSMKVAEVKREKLKPSLFEVPADYKKQTFPSSEPAAGPTRKGSKSGAKSGPKGLDDTQTMDIQKMMEEMKKTGIPTRE